jgi:hypothetical protein
LIDTYSKKNEREKIVKREEIEKEIEREKKRK